MSKTSNIHARIQEVTDVPVTVLRFSRSISKHFELRPNGEVIEPDILKGSHAQVLNFTVGSGEGLLNLFGDLDSHDCLLTGHFKEPSVKRLIPKKEVKGNEEEAYRTKDETQWSNGLSIGMLDVDKSRFTEPQQVYDKILELAPCLTDVQIVVRSSGSSGIYHKDSGVCHKGYASWHVFILFSQGTDIPDFTKWFIEKCWQYGEFRKVVRPQGWLAEVGLVDPAVASHERMIFEGETSLSAGLFQVRKQAVYGITGCALKPGGWPKLSADDKAIIRSNRDRSAASLLATMEETREKWLTDHRDQYMARGVDKVTAAGIADAALNAQHLDEHFILYHSTGEIVTVGEVIKNKEKYDNTRFKDPLEPTYRDSEDCASIRFLPGKRPTIKSYAHGAEIIYQLGGDPDALSKLIHGYVFVAVAKQLVCLENPKIRYDKEALNTIFANELGYNKTWKLWAESPDRKEVHDEYWKPGAPLIFDHEGIKVLNTCPDMLVPEGFGDPDADVSVYLEHMGLLYGPHRDWEISRLAFKIQNPGEKQVGHPVISSAPGVGKGMSIYPLAKYYGQFGAFGQVKSLADIETYEDELHHKVYFVVHELQDRDLPVQRRNALNTKLKSITADEGSMTVNVKYGRKGQQENVLLVTMFSNSDNPLEMEPGDRRYLLHKCREEPRPALYYDSLGLWMAENWKNVIAWLSKYDWKATGYGPKHPAPMTFEKQTVIEGREWEGRDIIERAISGIKDAWGEVYAVSTQEIKQWVLRHEDGFNENRIGRLATEYSVRTGVRKVKVRMNSTDRTVLVLNEDEYCGKTSREVLEYVQNREKNPKH